MAEYSKQKPKGVKTVKDKNGQTMTAAPGYVYITNEKGLFQEVPDTSIYEQEKSLLEETVKGIEGQLSTAEGAVGTAQKAGDASQKAARLKAAQTLASYRGMGEGGRGMALGQSAASQAGLTEASILADTAKSVTEEKTALSQARTEAAIGKKKLLEQEKMWQQEAIDASADIQETITRLSGDIYTDASDIAKIRAELVEKFQSAVTPNAKSKYKKAISDIDNKKLDAPGIDTWK